MQKVPLVGETTASGKHKPRFTPLLRISARKHNDEAQHVSLRCLMASYFITVTGLKYKHIFFFFGLL